MESDEDLLNLHRCTIGGAEGIRYIFTATPPGDRIDIDIVTRCETASLLVEAGWRLGLFRAYPLLIVGGGAAGVTAALTALALGVDGVAIATDVFFKLQRGRTHRYLHPHIYKWPHSRCSTEYYKPVRHGLPWKADVADSVAAQWDDKLPDIIKDGRFQLKNPIPDQTTVHSTADVTKLMLTEHEEQEWGMVLFCIAPKEITTVGDFTGKSFWEPDNLDDADCGCGSEKHSVLICGSGDGALQDFLRVSCPGKNIQNLHDGLEKMFDEVQKAGVLEIRKRLKDIDSIPRTNYAEIHEKCEALVDDLLASEAGRAAIEGFAQSVCAKFPQDRSVTLVWTRKHFQKCYLLNRFLTILVGKWRTAIGSKIFVPGARLDNVETVETQYRVVFEEEDCCLQNGLFDRVIPRFGIEDFLPASMDGELCLQKKPAADRA